MTDILELAAKVEALDGPCRETDEAICDALFTERQRTCIKGLSDADGGMNMWRYPNGHIANALRFTASLDAAMTLVEADDWREIKGPRKYLNIPTSVPNYWSVSIESWSHEKHAMGWGATAALALVAAALRAKAALGGEHGG